MNALLIFIALFVIIVPGIMLVISFLNRGNSSRQSISIKPKLNIPEDSIAPFIVCTFSMLGKVAHADGRVSQQETAKIEDYIDKKLALDPKLKKLALEVFHQSAASPLEFRDYVEKFRKSAAGTRLQLCDQIVSILLEVSAADGILSLEEEKLIHTAALLLGLSEPGFERIKKECIPDSALVH